MPRSWSATCSGKIAFDLDQVLFDALPASPARPAGFRSYNTRLTELTASSNDVKAMIRTSARWSAAAEQIAGGEQFYFVGRSKRIAAMRLMLHGIVPPNMVFLPSAASLALPESVLMCVIPRAVPSAIGVPEVELVDSGAVEMNDDPRRPISCRARTSARCFSPTPSASRSACRRPGACAIRPARIGSPASGRPTDRGGGGGGGIPDAPVGRSSSMAASTARGISSPARRRSTASHDLGAHDARRARRLDAAADPAHPFSRRSHRRPSQAIRSRRRRSTATGTQRMATTEFVTDVVSGVSGLPEAPPGPLIYGRNQGAWLPAIEEAPIDGAVYGRQATKLVGGRAARSRRRSPAIRPRRRSREAAGTPGSRPANSLLTNSPASPPAFSRLPAGR